ncbi:hypothetical protein KFK09_015250 [Dendrobium nobile]|uniref:DUF4283 domain-containing protein n=1 Tax=Dendrobium nobile TaxID=94219 RepID=A0A8T3B5D3_DENNO|nr:hypothetical protein KFK09_015250 [Dendrobium nobile]
MSDYHRSISFPKLLCGTSSTKEKKFLNLISKLDYELPLLKKTITAPDGTEEEDMLRWVAKLAMIRRGWKVMEKKLCASDVSDQHNRFMISKQIVEEKIKPMMTIEEIEKANLNIGERFRGGERIRGRVHDGLEVIVYDNSGQGYSLYLTRWDSSEASVLKGEKYKEFRHGSFFVTDDLVEMWAFKDRADKLCFGLLVLAILFFPPLLPGRLGRCFASISPWSWTHRISPLYQLTTLISRCPLFCPTQKLSFKAADFSEGATIWTHSLVGYSLGQHPYYERLLAAMNKTWMLKGSFSLLSMADGFFLLKFTSVEDMEMVFSGGPWFLLGKPFVLQKWNPKFKPKRDESGLIPIWIKILDLPLALWTPSGISKIASYIGIPISVDSLTARRTRLTFARVCVQISKNSPLPEIIPLDMDGEDLNLQVVYDWKPSPCEGCGSLFHPFALCSSNPNPKPTLPPRVIRGRSKSRKPTPRPTGTSKPPLPPSRNSSPVSNPIPPSTIITFETPSPSAIMPQNAQRDSILDPNSSQINLYIPNLNLPNIDTSPPKPPSSTKSLLPSQVVLANSFASLLMDNLNPVDVKVDENIEVEDPSSASKTESNNQQSASSSSKSSSKKKDKSPPKKSKTKSTAKKAKNSR